MNEKPLCVVNNLSKSYGKQKVLDKCDLQLYNGEIVGLVGENGSGKTTFLNCVLGFTNPSSGVIKYDCSIGFCPQDNVLNSKVTTREHFQFIEAIYKRRFEIDRKFIDRLILEFKLEHCLDTLIANLSSGTYQKVKLLTAIYHKPDLLLLDEPYDGFDWQMYNLFWKYIDEFKNNNTCVLMISHFIFEYDKFDKIFELQNGILKLNE